MVAFHVVLWHQAIIFYSGLVQKVGGVSLLEKGITDVFHISKNLVDGAGMPLGFACTSENTILLQTGSNLIHAEAFQVFSINALYDFCLFRVDDKVAFCILRVSEEAIMVDLHFVLLISELDAHLHVWVKDCDSC